MTQLVPADEPAMGIPAAAAETEHRGGGGAGRVPAGPQVATLLARHVRALLRQPAYLAISLVQAVVWLPLFGSLFRRVTGIPGFGESSYFSYLTPGVVMMSAFFSAGWAGMAFVQDMERGVMDRLLAAPVSRFSVVGAGLAYQALLTTVQSVVILLLGWALGADYHGVTGPLVLLLTAILLSTVVAALSMALALVLRTEEALIAATNFLALPLAFLSTAMMSRDLLPGWIRRITYGNPLDWAVTAARAVVAGGTDWAQAGWRVGALAAATAVATGLTLRAFRTYQRSL